MPTTIASVQAFCADTPCQAALRASHGSAHCAKLSSASDALFTGLRTVTAVCTGNTAAHWADCSAKLALANSSCGAELSMSKVLGALVGSKPAVHFPAAMCNNTRCNAALKSFGACGNVLTAAPALAPLALGLMGLEAVCHSSASSLMSCSALINQAALKCPHVHLAAANPWSTPTAMLDYCADRGCHSAVDSMVKANCTPGMSTIVAALRTRRGC